MNKKSSPKKTTKKINEYIDLYEITEADKSIIFKFKNNKEIVFDIINKKPKINSHINIYVSKNRDYLNKILSGVTGRGTCTIEELGRAGVKHATSPHKRDDEKYLVPIKLLSNNEVNEIFLNSIKIEWIKNFFEIGLMSMTFNPIDIFNKKISNKKIILDNIELISKTKKLNNQLSVDFLDGISSILSIKSKNLNDLGIDSWLIENACKDQRLWSFLPQYKEIKKGKHLDIFRFLWTEYNFPFLKELLSLKSFKFLLKKGYKIKPLMQYLCKDVVNQGMVPIIQDAIINDINYSELLGEIVTEDSACFISLRDNLCASYCNIEEYRDDLYFNSYTMEQLASYVKFQIDNNFEKFPKHLKTEIDSIKYKLKITESQKLENNFIKIKENLKKFEYFGEKYSIITPEKPKDIIVEGRQLVHCVGSYVESFTTGYDLILFMRNNLNLENPLITINIKKQKVNYDLSMCRGNRNRFPNEEEKLFLIEYSKKFSFNILENAIDNNFYKHR